MNRNNPCFLTRSFMIWVLLAFTVSAFGFGPMAGTVSAQSFVQVEPAPYDLHRVVQRALSHHLGVRVSRLQLAVVEHQVTEQRAALKPSLSVTARPNWFETPVPDPDALEFGLDADRIRDLLDEIDDWDACWNDLDDCEPLETLLDEFEDELRSLSEQLVDGLPQKLEQGRGYGIALNGAVPVWRSPLQRAVADAADWQVNRADVDSAEAAAGAIMQSVDAYFAVLRAEAAVDMAELALEEADLRLREIESRVDAGTATTIDRLQVEAERYGAEAQLLQAQGEATAARMMLNSVLGFDLNVPLQLATPSIEGVPFGNLSSDKMSFADRTIRVEDALRNASRSGEVRQAYADWQLAGAGAIVAEERAKPDLRVFGQGKWPEVELTLGVDRHGYLGGSLEWNRTYLAGDRVDSDAPASWFAGVELTWNVFDGGKQRAEVEAARLQAEQAALYYEHVAETTRTEVLAAYVRWQAAEEALYGVRQGVEAAQQGVEVARQLADSGAATEAAVVQAQAGLARARQGWLDALYGATMAHSAYLHAAGELVPYWQQQLNL